MGGIKPRFCQHRRTRKCPRLLSSTRLCFTLPVECRQDGSKFQRSLSILEDRTGRCALETRRGGGARKALGSAAGGEDRRGTNVATKSAAGTKSEQSSASRPSCTPRGGGRPTRASGMRNSRGWGSSGICAAGCTWSCHTHTTSRRPRTGPLECMPGLPGLARKRPHHPR